MGHFTVSSFVPIIYLVCVDLRGSAMNRFRTLALGIVLMLFALSGCGSTPISDSTSATETRRISAQWVDDFSDARKVAGYSTNVFVGKVTRLVRTERAPSPISLFEVEVEDTLKGKPLQTVIVRQEGGVITEDGKQVTYLLEEDTELLAIGQTYIFAGRPDKAHGYITLVGASNQGYIKTTNTDDKKAKIAKLRDAIKNQHIYPADMLVSE